MSTELERLLKSAPSREELVDYLAAIPVDEPERVDPPDSVKSADGGRWWADVEGKAGGGPGTWDEVRRHNTMGRIPDDVFEEAYQRATGQATKAAPTVTIVRSGGRWCLETDEGVRLGCYGSEGGARRRKRQIEQHADAPDAQVAAMTDAQLTKTHRRLHRLADQEVTKDEWTRDEGGRFASDPGGGGGVSERLEGQIGEALEDPQVAERVSTQLGYLQDRFGEDVLYASGGVGSRDVPPGHVALASMRDRHLKMNPSLNDEELERHGDFLAAPSVEGIIGHEYAHMLVREGGKKGQDARRAFNRQVLNVADNVRDVAGEVSGYADSNHRELLPEVMGAWWGGHEGELPPWARDAAKAFEDSWLEASKAVSKDADDLVAAHRLVAGEVADRGYEHPTPTCGAADLVKSEQPRRRTGRLRKMARRLAGGQEAMWLAKTAGDLEDRYTLAPVYVPGWSDAHDEWADSDDLQKALWELVRKGDLQLREEHDRGRVAGDIVEVVTWPQPVTLEMAVPTEKGVERRDVAFPAGTPFMGVVWTEEAWERVKKGELTGYSIGGRAVRVAEPPPT